MRQLPFAALLGASLLLGACTDPDSDEVIYAAEFFPDETGRPREGEPQQFLTAVLLEKTGPDGQPKLMAFPPPPAESAGPNYDPPADKAISLAAGNYDEETGRYYARSLYDTPEAHLNPHRAYSPYKVNGKYVEVSPGLLNYDQAAKKRFRVVPHEAPSDLCGGTGILKVFGNMENAIADDQGFTVYEGIRQLEDPDDSGQMRKRAKGRVQN